MSKIPETILLKWHKPTGTNDLPMFELMEDLEINGYKVNKGLMSDAGSIPLGLRNLVNPLGLGLPAFLSHDQKTDDPNYSRSKADDELGDDLPLCGVNVRRGWAMERMVKLYAFFTGQRS